MLTRFFVPGLAMLLLTLALLPVRAVAGADGQFRVAYLRGETIALPVAGVVDGTTLTASCTCEHALPCTIPLTVQQGAVQFSAMLLAAGRYALTVRDGDREILHLPLVVIDSRRGEVPFLGVYDIPAALDTDNFLDSLAQSGIDHVYHHINPWYPSLSWDHYFQHGLTMIPVLNAQVFAVRGADDLSKQLPAEQFHNERGQVFSRRANWRRRGDRLSAIPTTPRCAARSPPTLSRIASYASTEPGLQAIAFEDEFGLGFDLHNGVANYSDAAKRRFTEITGLPAPVVRHRVPGVIRDDDPDVRWFELEGSSGQGYNAPAIMNYDRMCAGVVHGVNPDLLAMTYPGSAARGMDVAVTELVPWSYRYSDISAWMTIDALRADSARRDIPIAVMPGYYAPDTRELANPSWIREELLALGRLALARGASCLDLFSAPALQHDGIRQSMQELGATQQHYGRFLRALTPMHMPVGILKSDFTSAFQYAPDYMRIAGETSKEKAYVPEMEHPWRHAQALEVGFPAVIKAGIPAEVVTDSMLAAEDLSCYRALILLNIEYMRQSTVRRLEDYIRHGGKVFVDRSSAVHPRGALPLDGDFLAWHRLITQGQRFASDSLMAREKVETAFTNSRGVTEQLTATLAREVRPLLGTAPVETASAQIVATVSESAQGRYVFLVNSHLTQAQTASVRINLPFAAAYDVFAGQQMNIAGGKPFPLTLPPAGWRLIALLPTRVAALELQATAPATGRTCRLAITARVIDAANSTIDAAFPLAVKISSRTARSVRIPFTMRRRRAAWSATW